MKTKLLIILAVLALIFTATLGIVAWKAGKIVAAYQPQIERKLSEAIGAEVTVGDISVSLLPHPQLSLTKLVIKGHGTGPSGLAVAALHARAALLPLLAKRLELSSIHIDQPDISLERTPDGTITVQGLRRPSESPPSPPSSQPATASGAPATPSESPLSVSIDEVRVSRGALTFVDSATKRTLTAHNIDFDTRVAVVRSSVELSETSLALTLAGNHTLSLTAEAMSFNTASKGVILKGVTVKTPAGSVSLSATLPGGENPGTIEIAAGNLSTREVATLLSPILPQLSEWKLSGQLGAKLSLLLAPDGVRAIKGPLSLSSVSATLQKEHRLDSITGEILLDGSPGDLGIRLPSLTVRYNETPLSVSAILQARPNSLTVQSLAVKGFEGTFEAPATLTLGAPSILSVRPVATGISITSALKAFKPALANTLSGTLTSFRGEFSKIALTNPSQTASGTGSLEVKNGILKGFNIPHQVLSKINNLPFLSDNLRKKVPPEFEAAVAKPDMVIRQLNAQFSVGSGIINISALRATSDIFTLQSSGSYSLAGEISLASNVIFTREFSSGVTDRVKELKPLVNTEGQLVVPVMVKGRAPAVIVLPNITEILQRTSINTLRGALSGALKGGKGGKGKGALGKILGF